VVSHTSKTTGSEPALRDHFFERVRPIVEKALAGNDRASWPLIILHFDFKTLDPHVIRGVWEVLGQYESWITTAPQTTDPHTLAPFDKKPLLVLTEDADEQEQIFFRDLPAGARLRVFGSAHTENIDAKSKEERAHLLATMPAESYSWSVRPITGAGGTTRGRRSRRADNPARAIGPPPTTAAFAPW